MKRSILSLSILFLLATLTSNAASSFNIADDKKTISSKIVNYLSSIKFTHDTETITMFSDFLINEEGELYNVDFIINEKGEILILNTEIEEEFYKVDSYSTKHLQKYTFPVAYINAKK